MRALKRLLLIAFALCAATCKRDTESTDVWLRSEDLKPATSPWQPVRVPPECDDVIASRAAAAQMLSKQPFCTDAAVSSLERFATVDPAARNDLAAGYALRASRENRPTDLLNALDNAEQAAAATPPSAAARFNLALIEESLFLTTEAIESWGQFLKIDNSRKSDEAHSYRDRLLHQVDSTEQWAQNRAQLPAALRTHNEKTIARLISPFPLSAERYLMNDLLTKRHHDDARTLANALSKLLSDRYDADLVAAMEPSPDALKAPNRNSRDLTVTGTPLALQARLGQANAVSFGHALNASSQAAAMLDPIEGDARTHGYARFLARIHSTRANLLRKEGRYVESLAESDAALTEYERERDMESVADTHMRRIGVFRSAGQNELAWREGIMALRESSHLADTGARHILLGEVAATALALGHPQIALRYQEAALRLIQHALVATPPEQISAIKNLEVHLGVVRRERAEIEIHLGQYDRASADLNEAIRLKASDIDPNARQILQTRIEEVRGQSLLRINPAKAANAFSEALRLSGAERRTNRALLLTERSEAQRRAGKNAEAEKDLLAAIDEVHAEELDMLEHRKRGAGEEIWSSYFSRFPETYQNLIRQLLNEGRPEKAFDYAERQRAFEPLYLISEIAPKDFDGKPKEVASIRQSLPAGTLLIEYSFLGDHAVAWLLSRDFFQAVPLAMPSREIERHSSLLQRAANIRNRSNFEAQSYVLYNALIAEPMAKFAKMPARLVIVPDGALHGLPFAALRNSTTRRYLIEDVPIEIAGSANLYLVSLSRDRGFTPDAAPSVLLIGDPAFDAGLAIAHGLQPLPHSRTECEKIYPFYANAKMLLERDATIPSFLEKARSSAVIHVAAHSIVNARVPSRSFILFAPSANQPGPLEAQALLTALSPLEHTRLVVLSTCSSAGGLPIGAEGVAPFVRPLIGAGVPAVVGTLWNVEDATAEGVLVSFHRHYRQGSDAAVALQQAQVELLMNKNNNSGFRPVLAWAGFQVIGHGSSPFASAPQHKEKPP